LPSNVLFTSSTVALTLARSRRSHKDVFHMAWLFQVCAVFSRCSSSAVLQSSTNTECPARRKYRKSPRPIPRAPPVMRIFKGLVPDMFEAKERFVASTRVLISMTSVNQSRLTGVDVCHKNLTRNVCGGREAQMNLGDAARGGYLRYQATCATRSLAFGREWRFFVIGLSASASSKLPSTLSYHYTHA
jgi:hypothetical protein